MRFSLQYIVLLFCLATCVVQAQPLRYNAEASGSYFPYATGNKEAPGIMHEYVISVMKAADLEIEHIALPAKRTQQFIHNDLLDFEIISPSWLSQQQRESPDFVFSAPLFPVREMLVTLPEKVSDFQLDENINGTAVGTVRGYYYHNDMHFQRVDFTTERELVLALAKNRVNVAIIGDLPALYWATKLDIDIAFGAEHSRGQFHIRLRAEHQDLLPRINKAIAQMKSQHLLEQLERKYLPSIND